MTKPLLAVFGAGTGLGAHLSQRFEREGYRVALVCRNAAKFRPLEGDDYRAFAAELSEPGSAVHALHEIETAMGRVDVLHYAPIASAGIFRPARELDTAFLECLVRLYLYSPVELVRAVLPSMLERKSGAIVLTHGITAVRPLAGMSGLGPVTAAARNYVYGLNAELTNTGVFAGTMTVGGVIAGSEGHRLVVQGGQPLPPGTRVLDPRELADAVWKLVTERTRVEVAVP